MKSVYHKISLSCLVLALFLTENVYGFFIPGTATILGSAISNVATYIIILISAGLLSLISRMISASKPKKFIALFITGILALASGIIIISEFRDLEDINKPNAFKQNAVPMLDNAKDTLIIYTVEFINEFSINMRFYNKTEGEEKKVVNIDQITPEVIIELLNYTEKNEVVCSDDGEDIMVCSYDWDISDCRNEPFFCLKKTLFNQVRKDYSRISTVEKVKEPSQLDRYKIFTRIGWDASNYFSFDIEENVRLELFHPEKLHEFLKGHEDSKLLFMCWGGNAGGNLAMIANMLGYDTKFAGIMDALDNQNLLDKTSIKELAKQNIIVTNLFSKRDKKHNDLYIGFYDIPGLDEEELSEDIQMLMCEDHHCIPQTSDKEDIVTSNLLCGSHLECNILKHWLFEHGFAEEVEEVYLLP